MSPGIFPEFLKVTSQRPLIAFVHDTRIVGIVLEIKGSLLVLFIPIYSWMVGTAYLSLLHVYDRFG